MILTQDALPADLILPAGARPLERIVPRVCRYPVQSYAYSSGMDAIEVAAAAGLELDDWQQLDIQLGLARDASDAWLAFQVALIVARQNGKGSILEALELYWLFVTEEPLIGHSAHEYKTAMEAFRRVLFLVTNTDWMRKKVKKVINTNGEEGIELLPNPRTGRPGPRLRFMARSKGAGRGFTFHKLLWDEAYALTGEQQDAQLPTLSAVLDPQIWLTSSPPLDSATGEPLFRLRRAASKRVLNGVTFLDYGAEGSLDDLAAIDLDDRATWERTNPAMGVRITEEVVERERASMSDLGFARERLCIWPPDLAQGFTVISKEQWEAMADPVSGREDSPTALKGRPALAVSVSSRNLGPVRASLSLASYREDGKKHVELIKTGPGTSWLVPDLIKLAKSALACAIVIDPGSPAGSVLADLEAAAGLESFWEHFLNSDSTVPELAKMTAGDVARAFGMIYDAATSEKPEDHDVVHLGQEELLTEVGAAAKRQVGDGHAWDSRNGTSPLTALDSVTKALWGLVTFGQLEDEAVPLVVWG